MVEVFIPWQMMIVVNQGFLFVYFFCFQRAGLPVHHCLVLLKAKRVYLSGNVYSYLSKRYIIAEWEKLTRYFVQPGFSVPPILLLSGVCSINNLLLIHLVLVSELVLNSIP